VDFTRVRVVALDEYAGLSDGHPASFASYVCEEIAEPLGLPADHVVVPRGSGADLE
jgi:glucosamine-6-phosphate deaminase